MRCPVVTAVTATSETRGARGQMFIFLPERR
jgi:hypothetical protein